MKRIVFLIALVTSALRMSAQVSVEAMIDSIQIFVGQQAHVTLTANAKENAKIEFPQFKPTEYITPGVEVLARQELEKKELDNGFVARSMVYTLTSFDDTLYYLPPMTVKIDGKLDNEIVLGVWEQSVERPDLAKPVIDKKTKKQKTYGIETDEGYGQPAYQFKLDKGSLDANGEKLSDVDAAYNPYIHSSTTPLNDQFSTAFKRPNLVTIELHIPKSELTSGYHAEKAKNSVGMKQWNAGVVQKKLTGTREVTTKQ